MIWILVLFLASAPDDMAVYAKDGKNPVEFVDEAACRATLQEQKVVLAKALDEPFGLACKMVKASGGRLNS